ncbi:hypothetical protein BKA69DRAFT_1075904 [Paraphysoderma sedebokerense]|nr:hypothetical protein BKA69DRAFT_1084991 [Paraphysoderma sedebokerense]KAI9141076.1 hypothetical protein BKA69DRAFT_1075904 [Paraphysoderma sedebokerense]
MKSLATMSAITLSVICFLATATATVLPISAHGNHRLGIGSNTRRITSSGVPPVSLANPRHRATAIRAGPSSWSPSPNPNSNEHIHIINFSLTDVISTEISISVSGKNLTCQIRAKTRESRSVTEQSTSLDSVEQPTTNDASDPHSSSSPLSQDQTEVTNDASSVQTEPDNSISNTDQSPESVEQDPNLEKLNRRRSLLTTCPFDSINLEENGLMFLGWHGSIKRYVNSIQESISVPSQEVTKGDNSESRMRFGDGFYTMDDITNARQMAESMRFKCLGNADQPGFNEDECDYSMCAVFGDIKWWSDVGKARFLDSLAYWNDHKGVLRNIKNNAEYYPDKQPHVLFGKVTRLSDKMQAMFNSTHTPHLYAVCTQDNIAHKMLETDITRFLDAPPSNIARSFSSDNIDTVKMYFGKYYRQFLKLSYAHNMEAREPSWDFYQIY